VSAVFALAAAAALALVAGLHVYWALGGKWPGTDDDSLAHTVVGGPPGMRMPGPVACLGVAVLLAAATALVVGAAGLVALPLPGWLVRLGAYGVAAVLLLRGAFGFAEKRLRPEIRGSRYARLNVTVYSPLCLALGAATLASTRLA
jgi:hypothetical protein